MFDFLKLKKEVSETTADIDANDVLSVKNKLKGIKPQILICFKRGFLFLFNLILIFFNVF